MSESFEIRSSARTYGVRIGSGLLNEVDFSLPGALVLCDARIAGLWPKLSEGSIISIPAEESAKTLETVAYVIEQMRTLGANRQSEMIAIGGGIIQDLATFSASTYMRGIEWIYYPTTLLGMADSCIGGKSSINVGRFKNIAGNYFPPREIVIDTAFCKTLPIIQIVAGLCEAVKICFADQGTAFDEYLVIASVPDLLQDEAQLASIISLSLRTKKKFVEEDEFDRGVRLHLNFGHTFGHAIESASHFSISHGVAVGIGTLAALHMSDSLGSSDERIPRVQSFVRHMHFLLSQVPGLANALNQVSSVEAFDRFKSDKKHRMDSYAVILFDRQGYLERRFIPINSESESKVILAFDSVKREINEI